MYIYRVDENKVVGLWIVAAVAGSCHGRLRHASVCRRVAYLGLGGGTRCAATAAVWTVSGEVVDKLLLLTVRVEHLEVGQRARRRHVLANSSLVQVLLLLLLLLLLLAAKLIVSLASSSNSSATILKIDCVVQQLRRWWRLGHLCPLLFAVVVVVAVGRHVGRDERDEGRQVAAHLVAQIGRRVVVVVVVAAATATAAAARVVLMLLMLMLLLLLLLLGVHVGHQSVRVGEAGRRHEGGTLQLEVVDGVGRAAHRACRVLVCRASLVAAAAAAAATKCLLLLLMHLSMNSYLLTASATDCGNLSLLLKLLLLLVVPGLLLCLLLLRLLGEGGSHWYWLRLARLSIQRRRRRLDDRVQIGRRTFGQR